MFGPSQPTMHLAGLRSHRFTIVTTQVRSVVAAGDSVAADGAACQPGPVDGLTRGSAASATAGRRCVGIGAPPRTSSARWQAAW